MADSPFPCVSVIVPVYNDPTGIRDTLTALTKQTYPTERVNILPIDNGSTDETRDVIRQFEREHENVTLVVEDEIQGSYAARNTTERTPKSSRSKSRPDDSSSGDFTPLGRGGIPGRPNRSA